MQTACQPIMHVTQTINHSQYLKSQLLLLVFEIIAIAFDAQNTLQVVQGRQWVPNVPRQLISTQWSKVGNWYLVVNGRQWVSSSPGFSTKITKDEQVEEYKFDLKLDITIKSNIFYIYAYMFYIYILVSTFFQV